MKIGLITTLETNIGDDFIRAGIIEVCRSIYTGKQIEFILINKHKPCTVYPSWHPIRWLELIPKKRNQAAELASRFTAWAGISRFEYCDMIIQCGAPVFWNRCHKAEWAKIIWRDLIGRLSYKIPVLNLAAGSCYPWTRPPSHITDKNDVKYITDIHSYCRETTVRDSLARELLHNLGLDTELIACSAMLAGRNYKRIADSNRIFVNFMKIGTHYDFHQNVNARKWHQTLQKGLAHLSKNYQIIFLCHTRIEFDLAREAFPGYQAILPGNINEYFQHARTAAAGIFNRLHASVAFAGLGIPSVAIGADTRMMMVEEIRNPIFFVKSVTSTDIIEAIEKLIDQNSSYSQKLLNVRDKAFSAYQRVISRHLDNTE